MAGKLYGLKFEDVGKVILDQNHDMIYNAEHTITNIRTARVKDSDDHFYIILSDVRGFLHILKGFRDECSSYSLVLKS